MKNNLDLASKALNRNAVLITGGPTGETQHNCCRVEHLLEKSYKLNKPKVPYWKIGPLSSERTLSYRKESISKQSLMPKFIYMYLVWTSPYVALRKVTQSNRLVPIVIQRYITSILQKST